MTLPHHVVLVGLPGVGKTTVGKRLAKRLERLFVDFDDEIQRLHGATVSQIFERQGEQSFREAEAQLSQRFAANPEEQAILSPGGGWIANAAAVAHLRPVGRIIYLRVTPTEALRRLASGLKTRPLFAQGDPQQVMEALWDRRKGLYEQLADLVVETDGKSIDNITSQIVDELSTPWRRHE